MANRSKSAADILTDGRLVLGLYRKHQAGFKKADAGRTAKLLPDTFLKEHAAQIAAAERGLGAVGAAKARARQATADEATVRASLHLLLTAMRDEVKLAWPEDKPLGRAFGAGTRVAATSTPDVLALGATVVEAVADPTTKKKAAAAGISAARIAQVQKLRAALAEADATQRGEQKGRAGEAARKETALAAIEKGTARIRKAAAVAFRGQRDVLAEFRPARPRAPARKKTAKAAPPPA